MAVIISLFCPMPFYVYILHSEAADRYYVGQTQDTESRLSRHNNGYEKSTSPFIPWKLILCLEKESRGEVMILEKKLKNLSRQRLREFIVKYT
jgi:putative endonuclease